MFRDIPPEPFDAVHGSRFLAKTERLIYRHRPLLHGLAGLLALVFSHPTDLATLIALAIVLAGVALRIWALAFVRKGEELCTTGPYALVRHPLYLGNFVVMVGITVAMNNLAPELVLLLAMAALYAIVIRVEERWLRQRFGAAYDEYASRVPALLPAAPLRSLRLATAKLDRKWIKAGQQIALLLLLLALFQVKEDIIIEGLMGEHYRPLWASVLNFFHSGPR